jgi:hypothetical protein
MTTKHEEHLQLIAGALEHFLKELYGEKIGFFLCVFKFNEAGAADYISNGQREDMIKALKETVERLEKNEVIPVTIGTA